MKILGIFFLISVIGFSKEILKDKALFRVAEEIIFVSDLPEIKQAIDQMRCLKTDGLLLSILGLDKLHQPMLPELDHFDIQKNRDFISKLILFKKSGHFIDTQNIALDIALKERLEKDTCIKQKFEKWSNDFKWFVNLEVYFRKRFVLERDKGQKENLISTLNSAKLFINSLAQKIPHYVFY